MDWDQQPDARPWACPARPSRNCWRQKTRLGSTGWAIDATGIEELRELAGIVDRACKAVQSAVQCLHRRCREVDNHCIALHELESQADGIHPAALARGFEDVEARIASAARMVVGPSGPPGTAAARTAGTQPDGAERTLAMVIYLLLSLAL